MTREEIMYDLRKRKYWANDPRTTQYVSKWESNAPRFSAPLDRQKPLYTEPLDRGMTWWTAIETTQVQPQKTKTIYKDTNPSDSNNLLWAAEAALAINKATLDENANALKEGIVESNTWKWFLALWASNAWAGTPVWQSVAALRLLNSNVRERLAWVDASKWDRLAQLESTYQSLKNQIVSNKETQDANKLIQTRQLDQQDAQIRLQKAQLIQQLRAAWMKDSEIFSIIK